MDKKQKLPAKPINLDIISSGEFKKRLDSGGVENALQFIKDNFLAYLVDHQNDIVNIEIEQEVKDVTKPGEKWKEKVATGRKTITIEIFESPREKRPPESPSKPQTQPHPDPSIGEKSTNIERISECGDLTEMDGQDPLYVLGTGPLCPDCHANMKSRFCEKWPKRENQL